MLVALRRESGGDGLGSLGIWGDMSPVPSAGMLIDALLYSPISDTVVAEILPRRPGKINIENTAIANKFG